MAKEKFEFYLPTDIDLDTVNIPCTLQICSISTSYTHYLPSLPATSVLLSLFSILFLSNVYLGLKHRRPFPTLPLSLALALEITGYASRIQLHFNPFTRPTYLLNLISLTTAPFLITLSIYIHSTLLHPVPTPPQRTLRPYRTIILFCIWDTHSLGLQLAGSITAGLSPDPSTTRTATFILLAGVATQVLSLALFISLSLFRFLRRARHMLPAPKIRNPKLVFYTLTLALVLLLARAIFRTVAFSGEGGWNGRLADDEMAFWAGDALMVWGACGALVFVLAVMLGRGEVRMEGKEADADVDVEDGE